MASDLSPAKCILLTVHYASEGNIKALHSFTPSRHDDLKAELVLRILLTYLPENIEPGEYTTYISEVASRLYLDVERDEVAVDISAVADINEEQARRKVKRLKLLDIRPPSFPSDAPDDLLTRFVCHRAYRIDKETGLLNLIPRLIEPFLGRNEYIRTWYIGTVLPLLRLQFEYYPEDESRSTNLSDFEKLNGTEVVQFLMRQSTETQHADTTPEIARDIRGLVGPWMYGHTERKRRRLNHKDRQAAEHRTAKALDNGMRKISLSGVSEGDKTEHDWEAFYRWLILRSRENFPLVTDAIEDWNGPSDVDLGDSAATGSIVYLDEDTQSKLEAQYAQAAFASCYAVEKDTLETIEGAHGILARLATLLDFIPPPGLATSVEALPKIERHAAFLTYSETTLDLEPPALLQPEHPLTTPRLETYMLLQMMVYSAYQLVGLGYAVSLVNLAKLHFYATAAQQMAALQKILRTTSKNGSKKDDVAWTADRAKLLWLWSWGIDADGNTSTGAGVLGKISKQDFEEEMLKCYIEAGCYDLVTGLYLKRSDDLLPLDQVEQVILAQAMETYDGATNGNRTRGGIKKANEIISTFRSNFSESIGFRQAASLISATHALSFYSLTLEHGVPFQPVSIRVSQDPVGLIGKVLDQDPGSYTKLDDLVGIGQNLVAAGLPDGCKDMDEIKTRRKSAERRVTLMAIEAALHENDFETAYSYIVNRLTPSSDAIEASRNVPESAKKHARNLSKSSTHSRAVDAEDDTSWRAAFLAGWYRPSSATPPSLRRLEQRTELLSLALLLAPVSALTEVLAAWRRCEEEMTALHASQHQAEEDFDDRADKRQSISDLPGNFSLPDEQPALVLNQKRRELGRMTGKTGNDEAPVSMFDLTRNAAQALSKNAFPLRAATESSNHSGMESSVDSLDSEEGQQRVRKRDMVANAVSGGLASGLGWVLGATPAHQGYPSP